jgi:hypothetical protein
MERPSPVDAIQASAKIARPPNRRILTNEQSKRDEEHEIQHMF